jgi:hypothetical protein
MNNKTGGSEMAWGACALLLSLVGLALYGIDNAVRLLEITEFMTALITIIIVGLGGKRLQNVWNKTSK